MELGSRIVERMIAANFGIQEDRMLRLRGRLDRLRKLECPTGVNTGKGRAATYGWSQIIELSVAVSLLDAGLSPDHAARLTNRHSSMLAFVAADLITQGQDNGAFKSAVEHEKWPIETTKFLHGTSFAIAGIKVDGEAEPAAVSALSVTELMEWFEVSTDIAGATFILDYGTKLASLIWLIVAWAELPLDEVLEDLRHWADDVIEGSIKGLDDVDT